MEPDAIGDYLKKIGRIPLLTAEQEKQLAQQVQKLIGLLSYRESLSEELGRTPTDKEWAAICGLEVPDLQRSLQAGRRAKEKMITANLRLVVKIAKKYNSRGTGEGLEFLDLVQEGSIGLNRAVERFDPELGFKFSTYAYWWVFQAISRALVDRGRVIRIPASTLYKMRKVRKKRDMLLRELGRTPTIEELADGIMKPERLRFLLGRTMFAKSLNEIATNHDGQEEIISIIPSRCPSPEKYVEKGDLWDCIENAIASLPPEEQRVIRERYLQRQQPSLVSLSQKLGHSKYVIKSRQNQAIERLKILCEKVADLVE